MTTRPPRKPSGRAMLLLTRQVRDDCRRAGVQLDAYDLDFVIGSLMTWLASRDAALTAGGLRRIRR